MKKMILIFCSILFNLISAQPSSKIPPTIFFSDFLTVNQIKGFRFYTQKNSIINRDGEYNKKWFLNNSMEEVTIRYGNEIANNTIYFHLMNSMDNSLNTHIYSIKISEKTSKKNMLIYFALKGLRSVQNGFMFVVKNLRFQEGNYFLVIDYNNSSVTTHSLNYNNKYKKKVSKNSCEEYLDLIDIKDYKITKKELDNVFSLK